MFTTYALTGKTVHNCVVRHTTIWSNNGCRISVGERTHTRAEPVKFGWGRGRVAEVA